MKTRIKKLRTSLNLTQEQFAKRLGLKQNTIAGYENGRGVPSARTVKLICGEYGVNRAWLECGEGEMFATPGNLDASRLKEIYPELTPETAALIQSIVSLPPEHQRLLAQFIQEGAQSIQRAGGAEAMQELAKQLQNEDGQAAG